MMNFCRNLWSFVKISAESSSCICLKLFFNSVYLFWSTFSAEVGVYSVGFYLLQKTDQNGNNGLFDFLNRNFSACIQTKQDGAHSPKRIYQKKIRFLLAECAERILKGTVSPCNKLSSEKNSVKNYNIHENSNCIWLYLCWNKMIRIPEMGRQCYALIDAMFIETM